MPMQVQGSAPHNQGVDGVARGHTRSTGRSTSACCPPFLAHTCRRVRTGHSAQWRRACCLICSLEPEEVVTKRQQQGVKDAWMALTSGRQPCAPGFGMRAATCVPGRGCAGKVWSNARRIAGQGTL